MVFFGIVESDMSQIYEVWVRVMMKRRDRCTFRSDFLKGLTRLILCCLGILLRCGIYASTEFWALSFKRTRRTLPRTFQQSPEKRQASQRGNRKRSVVGSEAQDVVLCWGRMILPLWPFDYDLLFWRALQRPTGDIFQSYSACSRRAFREHYPSAIPDIQIKHNANEAGCLTGSHLLGLSVKFSFYNLSGWYGNLPWNTHMIATLLIL